MGPVQHVICFCLDIAAAWSRIQDVGDEDIGDLRDKGYGKFW